MPNIVLRNLGVAGRQLPLAMLSQWRDVIQNIMHFPCITILPEIYFSYLILSYLNQPFIKTLLLPEVFTSR